MHCQINTVLNSFPATLQTQALWIGNLAKHEISLNTTKTYITGLKLFLVDQGTDDLQIFQHPSIRRMIIDLRRIERERERQEWLPVTKDILLRLLPCLDTTKELQATVHATYCLAFAGFLQIEEFTYSATDFKDTKVTLWHMTRGSVNVQTDRLLLSLPASKTDRFCKRVLFTIATLPDQACPVLSL